MSNDRQELRERIKDAVEQCLLDLWWNFDIGSDELFDHQNELNAIRKSLAHIAEKSYERNHTIETAA
jgi:hypothetical protein